MIDLYDAIEVRYVRADETVRRELSDSFVMSGPGPSRQLGRLGGAAFRGPAGQRGGDGQAEPGRAAVTTATCPARDVPLLRGRRAGQLVMPRARRAYPA